MFVSSGNLTVEALTSGEDNYDITFHVAENETCAPSSVFYTRFLPDQAAKLSRGNFPVFFTFKFYTLVYCSDRKINFRAGNSLNDLLRHCPTSLPSWGSNPAYRVFILKKRHSEHQAIL